MSRESRRNPVRQSERSRLKRSRSHEEPVVPSEEANSEPRPEGTHLFVPKTLHMTEGRHYWLPLSHVGLVSDYHGLQRIYESFLPLKFRKSIPELLDTMRDTLQAKDSVASGSFQPLSLYRLGDDEQDEEAEEKPQWKKRQKNKNMIFKKKMYKPRLVPGSTDKVDSASSASANGDWIYQPLQFENESSSSSRKFRGKPTTSILNASEHSSQIDLPSFRPWEDDPMEPTTDDDSPASKKKRPSRSAFLQRQKEVSQLLLCELYHTLQFIYQYNAGFPISSAHDQDADNLSGEPETVLEPIEAADRKENTSNVTAGPPTKRRKTRAAASTPSSEIASGLSSKSSPPPPSPIVAPDASKLVQDAQIDTKFLYAELEELRRQGRFPQPDKILEDGLEHIEAYIESLIEAHKLSSKQPGDEMEEQDERRRWISVLRGYKSKADQERIEKKEHEEIRQLKAREYEYMKHREQFKKGPEDLEYDKLMSRPVHMFSGVTSSTPRSRFKCPFEPGCSVCHDPLDRTSHSTSEANAIFNPSFQCVSDEYLDDDESDGDDEDVPPKRKAPNHKKIAPRRTSRIRERSKVQEDLLARMLGVTHSIVFCSKYNEGLLHTKKQSAVNGKSRGY